MKFEKLLSNKNVLYLVVALAILCSLGYICVSSYECLAVFVIAYFISCNYIKNKIICLLIALFLSNFIFGCSMSFKGRFFENFNGSLGPVRNTHLAGEMNKVVDAVGGAAGKAAAEAAANSGASKATQDEEEEKAKDKVERAAVEAFLS